MRKPGRATARLPPRHTCRSATTDSPIYFVDPVATLVFVSLSDRFMFFFYFALFSFSPFLGQMIATRLLPSTYVTPRGLHEKKTRCWRPPPSFVWAAICDSSLFKLPHRLWPPSRLAVVVSNIIRLACRGACVVEQAKPRTRGRPVDFLILMQDGTGVARRPIPMLFMKLEPHISEYSTPCFSLLQFLAHPS